MIMIICSLKNAFYRAPWLAMICGGCTTQIPAAKDGQSGEPPAAAQRDQVGDASARSRRTNDSGVNPLIDHRAPDESHSLPELSFKHLGMHIGGESNAPEAKEPFLAAISAQEEAILFCYRYVNQPRSSGSFGLDLYVGRTGGAPEIRGVRQKLGGEPFVKCMTEAFGLVRFSSPDRPTVLSYSLLFVLDDGDF